MPPAQYSFSHPTGSNHDGRDAASPDVSSRPRLPPTDNALEKGHSGRSSISQTQYNPRLSESVHVSLPEATGPGAHSSAPGLPLERHREFRHPLVSFIPTIDCYPSASLASPSPNLIERSISLGSESSDDGYQRSPGGRKHVDTFRDGPYLLTASRASFQGVPKSAPDGVHTAAVPLNQSYVDLSEPDPQTKGSQSGRTPHKPRAPLSTIRPLESPSLCQATITNDNGVRDIPRSVKAPTTTLKDPTYEVTSSLGRCLLEERFRKSAPLSASEKKKRDQGSRNNEEEHIPERYSWWEKNSDDSDSTIDLKDIFEENPTAKAVNVFRGWQAEQWQDELQELQWEKHGGEQMNSGPISTKRMWEKDLLLKTVKKQIQTKLQNDHILILQKLPPAALKIKVTTCAHPFCSSPKGCTPAGSYRLSLELIENLDHHKVPTTALGEIRKNKGRGREVSKDWKGKGANGAIWYCLTCLENLWNGVGQINVKGTKNDASALDVTQPSDEGYQTLSDVPVINGYQDVIKPPQPKRMCPLGRFGAPLTPTSVLIEDTPSSGVFADRSGGQDALQDEKLEEQTNFGLDGTDDIRPKRRRGLQRDTILQAAERAGSMLSIVDKTKVPLTLDNPKKPRSIVRSLSTPVTPDETRPSNELSMSPSRGALHANVYCTRSTPRGRTFNNPSPKFVASRKVSVSSTAETPLFDNGYAALASPIQPAKEEAKLRARFCERDISSNQLQGEQQISGSSNAIEAVSKTTTARTCEPPPKRQKISALASPYKMQSRRPSTGIRIKPQLIQAVMVPRSQESKFARHIPPIPQSYCTCQKPDDGLVMIRCSNDLCLYGWFHLACTGLMRVPDDEEWYCEACSTTYPKKPTEAQAIPEEPPTESSSCSSINLDGANDLPAGSLPVSSHLRAIGYDSATLSPKENTLDPKSAKSAYRASSKHSKKQFNTLKRKHSPSPQPPKKAEQPNLTPFQQLYSFIYPETRGHSSGYYTLSPPQLYALEKWKNTIKRRQMFENPSNRAFLARNGLLYQYDEANEDESVDKVTCSDDGPIRGVMEIGGLVVEVTAQEVRDKDLSQVMRIVDERVGKELIRLGYKDKPYKGHVLLRVGPKDDEITDDEEEEVSSGDEETSGSDKGEDMGRQD